MICHNVTVEIFPIAMASEETKQGERDEFCKREIVLFHRWMMPIRSLQGECNAPREELEKVIDEAVNRNEDGHKIILVVLLLHGN